MSKKGKSKKLFTLIACDVCGRGYVLRDLHATEDGSFACKECMGDYIELSLPRTEVKTCEAKYKIKIEDVN